MRKAIATATAIVTIADTASPCRDMEARLTEWGFRLVGPRFLRRRSQGGAVGAQRGIVAPRPLVRAGEQERRLRVARLEGGGDLRVPRRVLQLPQLLVAARQLQLRALVRRPLLDGGARALEGLAPAGEPDGFRLRGGRLPFEAPRLRRHAAQVRQKRQVDQAHASQDADQCPPPHRTRMRGE